jgi:phosphotransferase family enzyme
LTAKLSLVERPVHASVESLLAGASEREPLQHNDSKSGARLERVRIDGEWFVAKWLDLRDDWTMRAVGDFGGATLTIWRCGLLDALPACIDQPIVGVAHDPAVGPGGYGTVLLMRDVARFLVPEGDAVLSLEQHRAFLDHMAQVHATFWDFDDQWSLIPTVSRYFETSPWTALVEAELRSGAFVPPLIGKGWAEITEVAPKAAAIVLPLAHDPTPLARALEQTPLTFVHGNWKLGNLGTDDTGRTVLIDWEAPGAGPACGELAWYLALNCRRIPESKEAAITAFRDALEQHGVDTEPWWDRQCALALLGGLVQFGWEKALGGYDDELAWWEARAVEGARFLA